MTKKYNVFLILLIAVCLLTVNQAKAGCDGFYMAGRGGWAMYKIDESKRKTNNASDYVVDKDKFMASMGLGYRAGHFRAEAEYIWRRKNTEKVISMNTASFKSHSYMFVVYYDFFPNYWFTPFVNAGVGYTRNRIAYYENASKSFHKNRDNNFTWSLGAGVSAKLTNRWNLDFGYRYYDLGDVSMYYGSTAVTDHEVYMGLRYVF